MANEELANRIAGRDISHENDPYRFAVLPTAHRNEYLANKIAGIEEAPTVQPTQPVVEETPTAKDELEETKSDSIKFNTPFVFEVDNTPSSDEPAVVMSEPYVFEITSTVGIGHEKKTESWFSRMIKKIFVK